MEALNATKVKSIEFTKKPFRKLSGLKINFAPRITLIAGHNGIGKSTILGFVANTFGFSSVELRKIKSYFEDPFYANIEQILYISLDEIKKISDGHQEVPYVTGLAGDETIVKRSRLTKRAQYKRARVVPTTFWSACGLPNDFEFSAENYIRSEAHDLVILEDLIREAEYDDEDEAPTGPDAKIPLPTIFLGLRRLASVGEAKDSDVVSKKIIMDAEDAKEFNAFIKSVISSQEINDDVTQLGIKSSKKKSLQPGFAEHEALAISVGQDSLGSIATAIASFSKLKRELGSNYPGGLLVIDELDVGLHPTAIQRLATSLKSIARKLSLQIIATTHSPILIQALYPTSAAAQDSIIYLVDPKKPRLPEDSSLEAILNDMSSVAEAKTKASKNPQLCVYFEDEEASQFCNKLTTHGWRIKIARENKISVKYIPLGVGGSNLLKLPSQDPIFGERVLVADADTTMSQDMRKRGNSVKLPCPRGASGTDRSPENIVKNFLREMITASEGPAYDAMLDLNIKNPDSSKIEQTFFAGDTSSQRDSSKSWWKDHWRHIEEWKVIEVWAKYHTRVTKKFLEEFESAIIKTSKKLKRT